MKIMFASDIHGDIYKLNTVLDIYNKEKCNKLYNKFISILNKD